MWPYGMKATEFSTEAPEVCIHLLNTSFLALTEEKLTASFLGVSN